MTVSELSKNYRAASQRERRDQESQLIRLFYREIELLGPGGICFALDVTTAFSADRGRHTFGRANGENNL